MTIDVEKLLANFDLSKENLTSEEIATIQKEVKTSGKSPTLLSLISGMTSNDISRFCEPNRGGFKYDYLVVGAGLFGATFANIAHSCGKRVLVVERRPHIGGNAYTKKLDGIDVHVYGPHIFHTNSEKVWSYVNRFAQFNGFVNRPVARFKNHLYSMPINMHTFYQMFGIKTPDKAQKKMRRITRKYQTREPSNAEEMALSRFGKTIFLRLIKGYTEKQWGRECADLSPDILRRIPLRFTFDDNYFNDTYQGVPVGGYTAMIGKMLNGVQVLLNTNYIEHREELDKIAEKVVYSGPLDELMGYSLGALEYRSLCFESEKINKKYFQGNAVINYTEKNVPYTRIIEHKFFAYDKPSVQQLEHTIVTREVPAEWQQGAEPHYPISDTKNNELYERYRDMVHSLPKKYIIGGRLADYKYYNMDEVIEKAMTIAENELKNKL